MYVCGANADANCIAAVELIELLAIYSQLITLLELLDSIRNN